MAALLNAFEGFFATLAKRSPRAPLAGVALALAVARQLYVAGVA